MESQTDLTDPVALLDAGWRVRLVDSRHDLAHDFFSRSLELARALNDHLDRSRAFNSNEIPDRAYNLVLGSFSPEYYARDCDGD